MNDVLGIVLPPLAALLGFMIASSPRSRVHRWFTEWFNALCRPLRWLLDPPARGDDDRAVTELQRWHAVWERDHPDLIVHASYTDHLPAERPKLQLVATDDRRSERVITQGQFEAAAFSSGGWIRPPQLRALRPDPHPDPPCDHCVEVTTLGQDEPGYICTKGDA